MEFRPPIRVLKKFCRTRYAKLPGIITRKYDTPISKRPRTQLLSNGTYAVMVTTAGAGFPTAMACCDAWRERVTRDNWGTSFFKGRAQWSVWAQVINPF